MASERIVFSIKNEEIREYAELSGDSNPIHLDAESAIEAGLPGPCAHGMLVVGKILAFLQSERGMEISKIRTEFSFLSPVLANEKLHLDSVEDGENTRLRITCSGKLVMSGRIWSLNDSNSQI